MLRNAHQEAACIASDLHGSADERERVGRRRDDDEPHTVRYREVARPRRPLENAAREAAR